MSERLIIVESPSKARTLARFLGAGFTVKASMGHVRDLPKSRLGVAVDEGFTPEYEVIKGKEGQLKELRAAAKKADTVLLAADPDREGEAIAWHITQALKLRDPDRIVFHEITRPAVEAALQSPRKIDRDLVAAQEARRVIDRLVGYQLSPLLWKKVKSGLSAGRVQSVTVRLVVDREAEIDAFKAEESWTVDVVLAKDGGEGATLTARLHARRDEPVPGDTALGKDESAEAKLRLGDEAAALAVLEGLGFTPDGKPTGETPLFGVAGIEARQTSRSAPAPYITSTLQQDASSRLRFSPKRTMSLAQSLYEGADLGSDGPVGLITYMRTDSTRISDQAHEAAKSFISDEFGRAYVRTGAARKRAAKGPVQDAHEAIRPTDVSRTPDSVRSHLDPGQQKLYELIWRRFVASEMSAAKFDVTRVDIHAGDYVFRASGSVLRFDGFTKVWRRDDDSKEDRSLPPLGEGEELSPLECKREQHFTQPPPRYTEASLIKELEERGIGRPSTYAPTIDVVQERGYVRQEERRLHPSELGKTVDSVLRQHFPDIVDVTFTAELEKRLDGIEEGSRPYEQTVRDWYGPFAQTLTTAETSMERVKVPVKETGEACPECGEGQLVIRQSRFGEFTGCGRYPDCKYIKGKDRTAPQPTGEKCPDCSRDLVIRQGRRGPFVGCSGYPKCKYIRGDAPVAAGEAVAGETPGAAVPGATAGVVLGQCPECGKPLGHKSGRRGAFIGCTGYPGCKYIQPGVPGGKAASGPAPEPTGENCPECEQPLVTRQGRYGPFISCSGYPKCKYRPPKGAASKKEPATA